MNWNAATHTNRLTHTCYFVLRKLNSLDHYLDLNTRVFCLKTAFTEPGLLELAVFGFI